MEEANLYLNALTYYVVIVSLFDLHDNGSPHRIAFDNVDDIDSPETFCALHDATKDDNNDEHVDRNSFTTTRAGDPCSAEIFCSCGLHWLSRREG